jgi:putative peptidoglycan lipid II flippase
MENNKLPLMRNGFLRKSLDLLARRQTNILSAAFVIMATVIFSQILGLIRQRLMIAFFGVSQVGIYFFATILPDYIFQLTIAAAITSSFIPVFSGYIHKNQEKEGHAMASTLLFIGFFFFLVISGVLVLFAPQILKIFNLGNNLTSSDMSMMINLTRIYIFSEFLFILGTFFTALLQSYNNFLIPAMAVAFYNVGVIAGILLFSSTFGIYSTMIGSIFGGLIFVGFQIPLARKLGFAFKPGWTAPIWEGIRKVGHMMWPRAISVVIYNSSIVVIGAFISFLPDPAKMNTIFDLAKTLSFAPVVLFGNAIAQAAFPVLAREKDQLEDFKSTFINSFNQMLYLILPVSVLILVLRIPLVRLVYGAPRLDWPSTVLTGETLKFFAISIFAQALILLILRGFYALHDTKTPLIVSAIGNALLLGLSYFFVIAWHTGVEGLAIAFTIASIFQLIVLFLLLEVKVGGFNKRTLFIPWSKFLLSTFFTAFALYVPIKLLDQLVFDTTRTINLLFLTGISSMAGLSLYLFLTWLFDVKEASTYILAFRKLGNWREVFSKIQELVGGDRINP